MTINELFKHCDHLGRNTPVQLFKAKEEVHYYANEFENLSIQRMTFGDLTLAQLNLEIDVFWFENVDRADGVPELVMILLEVNEI